MVSSLGLDGSDEVKANCDSINKSDGSNNTNNNTDNNNTGNNTDGDNKTDTNNTDANNSSGGDGKGDGSGNVRLYQSLVLCLAPFLIALFV